MTIAGERGGTQGLNGNGRIIINIKSKKKEKGNDACQSHVAEPGFGPSLLDTKPVVFPLHSDGQ